MWIARDKDGELYLYIQEPYLSKKAFFIAESGSSLRLDKGTFPDVTFEKSPVKVKLVIEGRFPEQEKQKEEPK